MEVQESTELRMVPLSMEMGCARVSKMHVVGVCDGPKGLDFRFKRGETYSVDDDGSEDRVRWCDSDDEWLVLCEHSLSLNSQRAWRSLSGLARSSSRRPSAELSALVYARGTGGACDSLGYVSGRRLLWESSLCWEGRLVVCLSSWVGQCRRVDGDVQESKQELRGIMRGGIMSYSLRELSIIFIEVRDWMLCSPVSHEVIRRRRVVYAIHYERKVEMETVGKHEADQSLLESFKQYRQALYSILTVIEGQTRVLFQQMQESSSMWSNSS
ncbi:hypothetical protein Tco_1531718 [Tanacetum coccineum]